MGVEGTGSYGAGLARFLSAEGVEVKEVIRPRRQTRRGAESDPADAEAAARAVLSGEASGLPIRGEAQDSLSHSSDIPPQRNIRSHKHNS